MRTAKGIRTPIPSRACHHSLGMFTDKPAKQILYLLSEKREWDSRPEPMGLPRVDLLKAPGRGSYKWGEIPTPRTAEEAKTEHSQKKAPGMAWSPKPDTRSWKGTGGLP